ncbi:hypothetical protein T492DRAFT_838445 [Pavlovales sp. CCMP2436]|nr:hypothetical protein T492DRAFT_838445 [Pavlovales sp. CCMP2436]
MCLQNNVIEMMLFCRQRAADEHRDLCASGSLGTEYQKGFHVPRDLAKAIKYFEIVVADLTSDNRKLAITRIKAINQMTAGLSTLNLTRAVDDHSGSIDAKDQEVKPENK